MRGALLRVVAAAVGAGGVVGVVLGVTALAPPSPVPASLDAVAVPVYACPGVDQVGTLHRGDRVWVIGRSGDWLAVRNIRNTLERVFVAAASVIPDADLSALPTVGCDDAGVLMVAGRVTPPTVPEATTTTTVETTTTAAPTTTTASTTSVVATTTPADTTAPTIGAPTANPAEIWEQDAPPTQTCSGNPPRQATVSASVTDASGLASVVASWTGPVGGHQQNMSASGSTYSFTFGPYPGGAWDALGLSPYDHDVTITITATDPHGNSTKRTVVVTVWEVAECFG